MKPLRLALGLLALAASPSTAADIDFGRDVRGTLSNHCFQCHGPDANARKAGLRLDQPSDVDAREILRRIRSTDPDEIMPPPTAKKPLAAEKLDVLERWIDAGAPFAEHWAFTAPTASPVPPVPGAGSGERAIDPIDAFLLDRLVREGLSPTGEADPITLVRRVTLDLIGLPATLADVDAFVASTQSRGVDDAYARLVERLLTSPHHGEQMARVWLDAARYADTHGLHLDNRRVMWKYRDWVVDAFNRNLPFDRFAIEQLAGDLLPDPTLDQRVASGFNRCNVTTSEGGAIADEYLVKYGVDRVETVSTVFMGVTMGCAACHDHKYDPFTQRDFYRMFAYFNNTAEAAMDGNADAPPPVLRVPNEDEQTRLDALDARVAALDATLDREDPALDAAQAEWEATRYDELRETFVELTPRSHTARGGASIGSLEDGSLIVVGTNPPTDVYDLSFAIPAAAGAPPLRAIRLEALRDESLPSRGPGRSSNGNVVLSEVELALAPGGDVERARPLTVLRASADHSQPDFPIAATIDGSFEKKNGWAFLKDNRAGRREAIFTLAEPLESAPGDELRITLHFVSMYSEHAIGRLRVSALRGAAATPATLSDWRVAESTHPASREEALAAPTPDAGATLEAKPEYSAEGVAHLLPNGELANHFLQRTIHAPAARRMAIALGADDALQVFLNGEQIYADETARAIKVDSIPIALDLRAGENELWLKVVNFGGGTGFSFRVTEESVAPEPTATALALSSPPDRKSDEQRAELRRLYRHQVWALGRDHVSERESLAADRKVLFDAIPTTLIAQELAKRRPAHVLMRGEYDQKGDEVEPGVPTILPPLADGAPANRLGFANWLLDPNHPLTARVTVNRLWQQFFGTGLVKTSEDFGTQGEPPSHPELLDSLALRFIDSGWDVRALVRAIVTSRAYRRSAAAPAEHRRRDPENRLLARGPRLRLDAEVIRDQALAASGLLVRTIGGPPVKPYQPGGLWKAVGYTSSNTANFKRDKGDALWRRSLYTFWKRTSPPPSMTAFDAPSRETCTVRRERTNTPLAALVLMNDPQFVEAARVLAARVMRNTDGDDARIERAFRLLLARAPDDVERRELRAVVEDGRRGFAADTDAALALLAVGEAPRDEALDPAEHAAFTLLASLLLNLDETVTKG